jgi:hypothetical protein
MEDVVIDGKVDARVLYIQDRVVALNNKCMDNRDNRREGSG